MHVCVQCVDTFVLKHNDREVVGYEIVCISKGNVTFRLVLY